MSTYDFNATGAGEPMDYDLSGVQKSTMTLKGRWGGRTERDFLPLRIVPHPSSVAERKPQVDDIVWVAYDGWRMHFKVLELENDGATCVCWPVLVDDEDHVLIRERLVDMVTGVRRNPDVPDTIIRDKP